MLLFLLLACTKGLAQVQNSLLRNSLYLIDNEQVKPMFDLKDTLLFKKTVEPITVPKFATLWLKFHIYANPEHDSTVFINGNQQGYIKLFRINQNKLRFLGETGFISPYHQRSIRDDISTIRLILRKGESKYFVLQMALLQRSYILSTSLFARFFYAP